MQSALVAQTQFDREDSHCFVNHCIDWKLNVQQVTTLQSVYFKSTGYILSIIWALL
jgi:hypothetical protein